MYCKEYGRTEYDLERASEHAWELVEAADRDGTPLVTYVVKAYRTESDYENDTYVVYLVDDAGFESLERTHMSVEEWDRAFLSSSIEGESSG